jgi:putative ABC transport system permease protein
MNLREIGEGIRMAIGSLRMHKVRAILTTLGIIIGVMTVITIISLIQGLNRAVSKQVAGLGANVFYVQKYPWFAGEEWFEYRNRKNLSIEDAQAIAELCPSVENVAPVLYSGKVIKFKDRSTERVDIRATTPSHQDVSNTTVERGRFFTQTELNHRRQVCIIGQTIVKGLFPDEAPLGEHIRIGGRKFLVVGIQEKKGSMFGQDLDAVAVIPITTFQKLFGTRRSVSIMVEAKPQLFEMAKDEVTSLMRRRRHIPLKEKNDFAINTQDTIMNVYKSLTSVAFLVMIGVSSISLLVGGIGIMNIMLVSVTERTREIGIRKAIGAARKDILFQFLIEALILSGIGGIIGIGLGGGAGKLVSALTPLKAAIPLWSIILGLGFSSAVGLIFGIWPAAKAAKLDPIVALRYE